MGISLEKMYIHTKVWLQFEKVDRIFQAPQRDLTEGPQAVGKGPLP